MAKAKNESTAINDLINLVSTATPLPPDPDEDLMFVDPAKKKKSQAVSVPRMSATVPTLKVGADVAPLPRGRGAQGTGENLVTPPQVRVSTAPPSRQSTIPPLAEPASGSAPYRAPQPPIPGALNQRFDLSAASSVGHNIPASSIGIAVPAAPLPRPSTPKAELDEPTFDFDAEPAGSRHEQTWVGTVQTPKAMTTLQWIGKLAPIAGAMIVIGVFVGGYVAFDGQGGHQRGGKGSTPTVEMPKPALAVAADSDPGAIATPGSAPAPIAVEPAATEEPTTEAPATEAPKAEPAQAEPAPAQAEPAPAVAAPAEPIVAPKGGAKPVFTDVRIDSRPSGATVTLIDRGKRMFLGTTPIATSVDVARQYEVELVYKDRPAVVQPLDPTTTKKLSVEIHRARSAAPAALAAPNKAAPVSFADVTEQPAAKAEAPQAAKPEAPKAAKPEAPKAVKTEAPKAPVEAPAKAEPAAAQESGGTGILMISSKPPCEILIDGRPTGLTTPQRALPVSVGTHKVTLVNTAEKIKKTLTVQINADQPTKVIQDLMSN
ncbi:MAG: hypothetical protein JNL83_12015 [Myxococcales bacterium]|nr:hypothetical protein [Myxococcales bacterium]